MDAYMHEDTHMHTHSQKNGYPLKDTFYSSRSMHLLSDKNISVAKTHKDTNSRSFAQVSAVVFMDEEEKSM